MRKYFLEISHDFLTQNVNINPVPVEKEVRKYLLHIEYALKTGGSFDVAWSSLILNKYGYYRHPCGKPIFSQHTDERPTPDEVVCLNQVLYTVIATLALAEPYKEDEEHVHIFYEMLDRAFAMVSPWFSVTAGR